MTAALLVCLPAVEAEEPRALQDVVAEPVWISRAAWRAGEQLTHTRRVHGTIESTTRLAGDQEIRVRLLLELEEQRLIRVVDVERGTPLRIELSVIGHASTFVGDSGPHLERLPARRLRLEHTDGVIRATDERGEPLEDPLEVEALIAGPSPPLLASLARAVPEERLEPGRALEVPEVLARRAIGAMAAIQLTRLWQRREGQARLPVRRLVVRGTTLLEGVRCAVLDFELVRELATPPAATLSAKGTIWVDVGTGRLVRSAARIEVREEVETGSEAATASLRARLDVNEEQRPKRP